MLTADGHDYRESYSHLPGVTVLQQPIEPDVLVEAEAILQRDFRGVMVHRVSDELDKCKRSIATAHEDIAAAKGRLRIVVERFKAQHGSYRE